MKNLMMPLILLLGVFLNPIASMAREGKDHGGMKEIMKQLDLTDEQKEKLKSLREENKKMEKGDKGEIKELWKQMEEKFGTSASESELRTLHDKMKSLRTQKADNRFNRLMKIRNILTVEQRKKFQELRKKDHRGGRRHHDEE